MTRTCTRRLEFDAAHRVTRHESKCRHLHGHRYAVEVTVSAESLDDRGRVIDFGAVKDLVGGWIDANLDHGTIIKRGDPLGDFVAAAGWKLHVLDGEPTAENIAEELHRVATDLLGQHGTDIGVVSVRVYETPNCWADFP